MIRYTTRGRVDGVCGHEHATPEAAKGCLLRYQAEQRVERRSRGIVQPWDTDRRVEPVRRGPQCDVWCAHALRCDLDTGPHDWHEGWVRRRPGTDRAVRWRANDSQEQAGGYSIKSPITVGRAAGHGLQDGGRGLPGLAGTGAARSVGPGICDSADGR